MAYDVDVAIVGAGHNGLVAATYLARSGLRVAVFERRPFVGGGAISEELWPGFRFSTCAHAAHAIHPKIIRDLDLYNRGFEVLPRRPNIVINVEGTYWAPAEYGSPRNLTKKLTDAEGEGERKYSEFRQSLMGIFSSYRLGPPPTLEEVRAKVAGTPAAQVLETALKTRIRDIQDELLPSPRLRDKHATECASFGRNLLALAIAFSAINLPDEETGEPPPNGYIRGGTGTFSRTLQAAAEEAGTEILVNHEVESLIVEGGRVLGVRFTGGEQVRARVTVSNLDPKQTFLRLIVPEHLPSGFLLRVRELVTHVSAFKLLAVISELPRWKDWDGDPDLPSKGAVGLWRSRASVEAAFDDLDGGQPTRVPLVNFSVPSAVDPSLTQPGYHTASLWVYPGAARLRRGTWDQVREQTAERIIDNITRFAPNFRGSIVHYRLRTPQDLERENGFTDGCIWHIQHTPEQLFWNRPLPELAHYRTPLKGLYLSGCGQHPGGELSGLPGHNAAQEVLKDLGGNGRLS